MPRSLQMHARQAAGECPHSGRQMRATRRAPRHIVRDQSPLRHAHGSWPPHAPATGRRCQSTRCLVLYQTDTGSLPPNQSAKYCVALNLRDALRLLCRPECRRAPTGAVSPRDARESLGNPLHRRCRRRAAKHRAILGPCRHWRASPIQVRATHSQTPRCRFCHKH